MYEILLGLFLIVALLLIVVILLQQGKGADMGASFGAGGANTVFGASGAGNFLTRSTWILAGVAMALVLTLAYLSAHRDQDETDKQDIFAAEAAPQTAPVVTDVPVTDVPVTDALPAASDVPAATEQAPVSDVPN